MSSSSEKKCWIAQPSSHMNALQLSAESATSFGIGRNHLRTSPRDDRKLAVRRQPVQQNRHWVAKSERAPLAIAENLPCWDLLHLKPPILEKLPPHSPLPPKNKIK